jgi:hypothetical protein
MMKKIISAIASLMLMATIAQAQFSDAKWNFSLSGGGITAMGGTKDTVFANEFGMTYNGLFGLPNQFETGLRQGIAYSSADATGGVWGRTAIPVDFNFTIYKNLKAFVGFENSVAYGDNMYAKWQISPEAGIKYQLKEDLYLFTRVNYDFVLNSNVGRNEDAIRYGVGISFSFGK